jgi:raffinose/stachyose/melibiose transport system permease protein
MRSRRSGFRTGAIRRRNPAASARAAIAFALPAILLYSVFFIWPVFNSFGLSLFHWRGIGPIRPPIGFDNFVRLASDASFGAAVWHSIVILIVLLVVTNTISVAIARLLNRPSRLRGFYRAVIVLPYVLSPLVVGFIWVLLLSPDIGLVNPLLEQIGLGDLRHSWLSDPATALPWIAVAMAWQWSGLASLIFLTGFQDVREELLEAARMDGASPLREFWSITVPQLAPAFTVANVLGAVFALRAFDIVYVIGGPLGAPAGSTTVMSTVIYGTAFGQTAFSSNTDMSYAMTQGIAQFGFVGIIAIGLLLYFARRERSAR